MKKATTEKLSGLTPRQEAIVDILIGVLKRKQIKEMSKSNEQL